MNGFDWTQLRTFLAVLDTGSLSRASRQLELSQPTLGRHIRELEAAIGALLFTRSVRGLAPTETALTLIGDARLMGQAAEALQLKARGKSVCLEGTVRITASVVVANLLLPPIIANLREAEPSIRIEIDASDASQNLLRRDADIAIRMVDPTQESLIARKLGQVALGLFGTKGYLERKGYPANKDDLRNHDIIGFDRDDAMIKAFSTHGLSFARSDFPLRCDDQMVAWNLLLAGAGLGFAQEILTRNIPTLKKVHLDLEMPSLPVWLVLHEDVRTNAHVRYAADFIASALAAILSAP